MAARTAVAADALAEEAWRLLMQALWAAGRRAEALRAYAELREQLASELGAEPSAQTAAVFLELLSVARLARRSAATCAPRIRVTRCGSCCGCCARRSRRSPACQEPGSDPALARVAVELARAS